jgi:hypothetical protein
MFAVEIFALDAVAETVDLRYDASTVGWHYNAGYNQTQGSHLLKEFANCVCGCQNGPGGDCHY